MNKAWITYLAMLAAVGAGMWAILYAGARLQAPPDLSGRWLLQWDVVVNSKLPVGSLQVEQSGLFFNVRVMDGTTLRAIVHGRWTLLADGSFEGQMSSDDGRWKLHLRQNDGNAELYGMFTAPQTGAFSAHKEPEKPAAPASPG